MITREALSDFLKKINNEDNSNLLNDHFLELLVSQLMEYAETRPLPNIESIEQSANIKDFFVGLFKNLQPEQEKANAAASYLATLPSTIEEINLAGIKDFFPTDYLLNMRLNRYLGKKDPSESEKSELLAVIKSKLVAASAPIISPLSPEDKRELTKISLTLHSARAQKEIHAESGAVNIIHFFENNEKKKGPEPFRSHPRASEHYPAYDSDDEQDDKLSFDKTSHGLGSGVYGVGNLPGYLLKDQLDEGSHYQIVTIEKPLRLDDTHKIGEMGEAVLWTDFSKFLQRLADEAKIYQKDSRSSDKKTRREAVEFVMAKNSNEMIEYAGIISKFKKISPSHSQGELFEHMKSALQEFFQGAKKQTPDSLVAMPINYFLEKLGFTGVVSSANDMFNRGLILTDLKEKPYSDYYKIAVKELKAENVKAPSPEKEEEEESDDDDGRYSTHGTA